MPYGSVLTDTVQSSTSGTPPQFNDGNGTQVGTLCRAWGSYAYVASGSVPTVRGSFNISSITRNSAGSYTFAFTNALADTNYSGVANATYSGGFASTTTTPSSKSTSSVTFLTGYVASGGSLATGFDYGIDFQIFR